MRACRLCQALPDELVEPELVGSRDFDGAVQRRALGDARDRAGDVVRRHGLDEHRGHAHDPVDGGGVGDALD
ncbi:MAG: hypothetical protein ACRDJN_28245, partial [Chloroflexota bacterium]